MHSCLPSMLVPSVVTILEVQFGCSAPGAILMAFPRHDASGEKATRGGVVYLDEDND